MKILLDESVPRDLAKALTGHEVRTVRQMGWLSMKNGALLKLTAEHFEVFITLDQNLPFQQNLAVANLGIVVLAAYSSRMASLMPLVPRLLVELHGVKRGDLVRISA